MRSSASTAARRTGRAILTVAVAASILGRPSTAAADTVRFYKTQGTARVETCRGVGFQWCSSDVVPIPLWINSSHPTWRGLYHYERDEQTTCTFGVERIGYITTRTFYIPCTPLSE